MARKFLVKVNGETYEVEVEEVPASGSAVGVAAQAAVPSSVQAAPSARLFAGTLPGATQEPAGRTGTGAVVTSPLPSTVVDIKVGVGQAVQAGDVLLVIEAMKMEVNIEAPAAGVVKEIAVSKGQTVDAGDVLVVIG